MIMAITSASGRLVPTLLPGSRGAKALASKHAACESQQERQQEDSAE